MISFCLIARNAAKTLPATLESIRPVCDELVVVDTGSSDATVDILKAAHATVECVTPDSHPDWFMEISNDRGGKETTLARFDLAREKSFAMASGDLVFWIDCDDTLIGVEHWPQMLAEFRAKALDAMILPYDYMFDSRGHCTTVLLRERLLRKAADFRWENPVHEIISTSKLRLGVFHGVRISHRKHLRTDVNRRRNLEILLAKGGDSPRTRFYLGVEHATVGQYRDAAEWFEKYLDVAQNEDESYQALVMSGELHRVFGQWQEAVNFFQKAVIVRPDWRGAYTGLAMLFAQREDWARAVTYGEEARKRKEVLETSLPWNPHQERLAWIAPLSRGYLKLGDSHRALEVIREGMRIDPHWAGLSDLEDEITRAINDKAYTESSALLIEGLLRRDQGVKAVQVAETVNDESPMGILARQAFYLGVSGALPGRAMEKLDLQEWMADGRLGWFHDWMLDHPKHQVLAFPGCGGGLLARSCHDLLGRITYAWDSAPGIKSLYPAFTPYSVVGKGLQPEVRGLDWMPEEPMDATVLSEVLEYANRPQDVIARAIGNTRPGGDVVVIVPDGPISPHGPAPTLRNLRMHSFTARSLRHITSTWQAPTRVRDKSGVPYLIAVHHKPGPPAVQRRIGIYCQRVPEAWDWRSLETGIGGSEEAVIRMARELATRGHAVTVFGDTCGQDGAVRYETREDYAPQDLLVVWRFPETVLSRERLQAETTWLWMEDIVDEELLARAAERVDRILVMSQWHVGLYPKLASKMVVVGNGVDPAEFISTAAPRAAHKFIWASCPTRGLEELLGVWPEIRGHLPDAELDVYYGFDMIRAILPYKAGEELKRVQGVIDKIEKLKDQPGVTWKGRVGHHEIAQAMQRSGVWAYPTSYDELYSTTAAKAQAAGCWPVIYERAALGETVGWGARTTKENLVKDCVAAAIAVDDREPMRRWARDVFRWERVAEQWDRLMETP